MQTQYVEDERWEEERKETYPRTSCQKRKRKSAHLSQRSLRYVTCVRSVGEEEKKERLAEYAVLVNY